jgi:hypothetical protein
MGISDDRRNGFTPQQGFHGERDGTTVDRQSKSSDAKQCSLPCRTPSFTPPANKHKGRKLLAAQLQGQTLSKRAPQSVEEIFTMIGSFLNYAKSFAGRAPSSKVADVQEQASTTWSGARRKKIRYGPFRIPPTSVSVQSSYMDLVMEGQLTAMIGRDF